MATARSNDCCNGGYNVYQTVFRGFDFDGHRSLLFRHSFICTEGLYDTASSMSQHALD